MQLHWLPIQQRVTYKDIAADFLVAHGNAPEYLSELRVLHKPNRALRLANQPFFKQRIHSPRFLAIKLLRSLLQSCGTISPHN